ncbi:MAG: class I SAM-dependent methyltransferase [Acidobacteriota bacterium]|nr:class I SAM-dependent methyltransferase [Acidobacteriota bacterium]
MSDDQLRNESTSELATAKRFDDRVKNYIAYRPKYPAAIVEFLRDELGLKPSSFIADVGSGTGILSELFLRNGNQVYGVEPNAAMRAAAEDLLKDFPNFHSIDGTAETTGLPNASVDFATAGQAFHWFDTDKARAEFARILKPEGYAVIIWNLRRTDSTPFLRDYESLLRRVGTDYAQVAQSYAQEKDLQRFFANNYGVRKFDNHQHFDFAGLRGRSLSASYVPLAGQPGHEDLLAGLQELFARHQQGGTVTFEYDTEVYFGKVSSFQFSVFSQNNSCLLKTEN